MIWLTYGLCRQQQGFSEGLDSASSPSTAMEKSRNLPTHPYPWSTERIQLRSRSSLPRRPTAPLPPLFPRYGHSLSTAATTNGELLIFGGTVNGRTKDDLYSFSPLSLSTILLHTGGEAPSPRVGHASALAGSAFIVWGGDTTSGSQLGESNIHDEHLYILNMGKYTPFPRIDDISA